MDIVIITVIILTFVGMISLFSSVIKFSKEMYRIEYIFVGNKNKILRLTINMCISSVFVGNGIGFYFAWLLNL